MAYELQIDDVSTIRRRLNFSIAEGEVKAELDAAFRNLKRKVRLPGFRPGKVPRNLLEARFGKQVRSEVAGRFIEDSYREAAVELAVAGRPAVEEQGEVKAGQSFTFSIGVDVRPSVEVSGYEGLAVRYPLRDVSDDEVEGEIKRILGGKARIEEVTDDRPVQDGDFVLTELVLKDGDEELVTEAGTLINTRAERYYPGVEGLLIGLAKDGSATGKVTISEASLLDQLKGKEVEATVKVLGIQAHVVPDLSDELAAELDYEGGAEGMRGSIRFKRQEAREADARNQARVDLLEKLVAANDFEVPEGLVKEQLDALIEELKVRRAYGGQDPRSIRFSETEMTDLQRRAVFAAKSSVILASVAEANDLGVSDDELNAKIKEIADMRGQAVEAIRGYLEKEGATSVLKDRILEEKTLEWLLERAELQPVDWAAEAAAAAEAAEAAEAAAPAEAAATAEEAAPSWNKKMKKADLIEVAKGLGLSVTTKMKKAEIIAVLEAAG